MSQLPANPESPAPSPQGGLNLYRNPLRVGILAVLAGPAYPVWWTWQLFKFTRREGFPRASSFWWTLLPIVGLVVIWRQLDDLKKAAGSKARVYPLLVIALLAGGYVAVQLNRINDPPINPLLVVLLAFLLTGLAIYLAQRSITSYLGATYPTERLRRLSVGEGVATFLGLFAYVGLGALLHYWTVADSGLVIKYLPAANPVTDIALPGGWMQYRDTAAGFKIQLPTGWASVDYDINALEKEPTNVIKFYAEANDKSANLLVMRASTSPITLDRFAENQAAGLQRMGMRLIEQRRVQLPAGDAERMTFTRTYRDEQGEMVTDYIVRYDLVDTTAFRTHAYVLQFIVADAITDEAQTTMEQIVSTFRLL